MIYKPQIFCVPKNKASPTVTLNIILDTNTCTSWTKVNLEEIKKKKEWKKRWDNMKKKRKRKDSVTVHTAGRNEEHADVDKLKLTVFNKDKAGQTHRNTGE